MTSAMMLFTDFFARRSRHRWIIYPELRVEIFVNTEILQELLCGQIIPSSLETIP